MTDRLTDGGDCNIPESVGINNYTHSCLELCIFISQVRETFL